MKPLFEKFLIIRLSDLESVADIHGKTSWFTNKHFGFVVAGGWVLSILLTVLIIWSCVSHQAETNRLKTQYLCELNALTMHNDSLKLTIEEIERMEQFVHCCFEALTTKCPKATHDNVWEFIKKCDPWYPDIIMMQAVLESGCGKSNVGKRCNNMFGMKKPYSRELRCDMNRNNKKEQYAEYLDWRFGVIDRILWDRWIFRNKEGKPSIDEYLGVIDGVYNTETKGYGTMIYKNTEKYRKMM